MNPANEKVTGYYKTEVQSGLKNNFLANCELQKPVSKPYVVILLRSADSDF